MTALILPCWAWLAGIGLYVTVCATYHVWPHLRHRSPVPQAPEVHSEASRSARGPFDSADGHRTQAIHDWQMQQGWKP